MAESAVENVAESAVESVAESVAESAAESVAESAVESVAESAVESAAESKAECGRGRRAGNVRRPFYFPPFLCIRVFFLSGAVLFFGYFPMVYKNNFSRKNIRKTEKTTFTHVQE